MLALQMPSAYSSTLYLSILFLVMLGLTIRARRKGMEINGRTIGLGIVFALAMILAVPMVMSLFS